MRDLPTERSLTHSTLTGLAWQYTSVVAMTLLQLVVLGILARLLSPADFGLLGIAMIFVSFAALLSQLGVGPALIQRKEITTKHIRVAMTLSILVSLALTIVLWAATPYIARFFREDELNRVVPVISLNFFFAGFGVVSESLLKRELQFNRLMWANIGSYIVGYAAIGITLGGLGFGVWALVAATLGQSIVKSTLLFLLRPHSILPSLSRRELYELLHFGGGFTIARLLNYTATQGDYFVVGRVLGPESLGIYTRAYQLMMLPGKYFGDVLGTVLFPVMARIQHQKSLLTNTYLTGAAMISITSAPLSIIMVILAPEIILVFLGPKWVATIVPFQILSAGVLLRVSYKLDDALARALGAMYRRSVRDGIYAFTVVAGSLIGTRWGLPGVALGVLGAILLNYILAIRMSMQLLDCSWMESVEAQKPGIILAILTAFVAGTTRTALHANGSSSLIVLVGTILVSGLSLSSVIFLRPQILGVYGMSAINRILSALPTDAVPSPVTQWLDTNFKLS